MKPICTYCGQEGHPAATRKGTTMTNFDTVREALAAIADTHVHTYKQALTALDQIERTYNSVTAGQEPVAWQRRMRPTWGSHAAYPWSPWEPCPKECAEDHWKTPLLHEWAYEARALYAAPVAQQPCKNGNNPQQCTSSPMDCQCALDAAMNDTVAQQPQARPDFTDEWTGYLKDGETPFERFLRERKDLNALTKLYQRALEENERLKAQQARQCGLCGSDEAFTGTCGGGRRDPRALCYEPVAQQPQAKRTWLTDPRQTKERQFAEFLNDRRNMNVSAVFHDLMGKFAALTAPQQAEAVPPGYVLVPIEPTKKMVDAGGFVKIEVTYTYAGYVDVHIGDDAARNAYRAMIAAAQGEKP